MGALFLVNFQQLTFDLSSVLSPHVSSLTVQQKHSKYTCSMYLLNVNKYNFLRAIKTASTASPPQAATTSTPTQPFLGWSVCMWEHEGVMWSWV